MFDPPWAWRWVWARGKKCQPRGTKRIYGMGTGLAVRRECKACHCVGATALGLVFCIAADAPATRGDMDEFFRQVKVVQDGIKGIGSAPPPRMWWSFLNDVCVDAYVLCPSNCAGGFIFHLLDGASTLFFFSTSLWHCLFNWAKHRGTGDRYSCASSLAAFAFN